MKKTTLTLIALSLGASLASADHPCKDKRKAMHDNRVALRECNKAWMESIRGDAADPADDCAGKQTAFTASVKELKACVKQAKATQEKK